MTATLRVHSAGLLTTIQDLGRPGMQRYGVPISGAMDTFALAAANRLVGNSFDAAALEITSGGAIFELLAPTLLAVAGAHLRATLNDQPLPLWTAVLAPRGALLRFTARHGGWGARAYLALAGGIGAPVVLGSRSTYLPGSFGGMDGRPLRAGDQLGTGQSCADPQRLAGQRWPEHARPPYSATPTLRMIPGPHSDCFSADALDQPGVTPLRVSQTSNRMGYRLEGVTLRYTRPCSLPSLGVLPGAIQVPPDGTPILLMADAQTTGGYPIIGVVIGPDLPLAAQLLPGDALRCMPISIAAAVHARATWQAQLATPLETDAAVAALAWAGAPA
jgi:biotin-dependent carboxylase-like uncharacterized protein